MGFKGLDDALGADGDVMVAENGVALRAGEAGKNLSAHAGGVVGDGDIKRPLTDEISGQKDKIRLEQIGATDELFQKIGFCVLLQMDIADLDDAEALKGVGQFCDGDVALNELDLV